MEIKKKLIIILSLVILSAELIVIPMYSSGYRVSIYRSLPLAFLISGIGIIFIFSIATSYYTISEERGLALFSQLPIVSIFIGISMLPILLDYQILRGDLLFHASHIETIVRYNGIPDLPVISFGAQNRPGFHIIGASILLVADSNVSLVLYILQNYAVLTVGAFLFSLSRHYGVPGKYTIPSLLSLVGIAINPSSFTYIAILPNVLFVWYLVREYGKKKYIYIFLLMGISWIFHPVPPIFLTFIFFIDYSITTFTNPRRYALSFNSSLASLLAYSIIGFIVYTSTRYFSLGVRKAFLGKGKSNSVENISASISTFDLTYFEILTIGVKRLGDTGIIIGIGLIGLGYDVLFKNNERFTLGLLLTSCLVFIFWSISELIIGNLIAGWGRALLPASVVGTVGVGLILFKLSTPFSLFNKEKTIRFLAIFVIIFSILGMGAGNAHLGPWTESSNSWVADSEVDGWDWYFNHKIKSKQTMTLGSRVDRFAMYLMTPNEYLTRYNEVNRNSNKTDTIPANYGYPEKLGKSIPDAYYISSKAVRQNRVEVHPEWKVLTKGDISRLEGDDSVNKIYDNSNIRVREVQ